MKKLRILIFFLLILFLVFLYFYLVPKNYSINYKVDNYNILEKYNKEEKYYYFKIKKANTIFEYCTNSSYIKDRKLIEKVTLKDNKMSFKIRKLGNATLIKKDNYYITKYYKNKFNDRAIDEYNKIKIYNINANFYIWNYNSFINISNKGNNEIKVIKNDIYEPKLIVQLDDDIIMPNYVDKYSFNELIIINSLTNKINSVKLNKDIYYNSYILGTFKDNFYLYDIQNEIEYKINPYKGIIQKNDNEILINNEWKKVSKNKLKNNHLQFENSNSFYYTIEDNKLFYLTPYTKTLVSNLKIDNIITSDGNNCYFISNDSLYYVDKESILKIMQYSEWKYNNQNIFIF